VLPAPSSAAAKTRARVLVVDDHPVLRRGVAQIINGERDLVVCGEADSAAATLGAITKFQPDILLLDLRLGAGGGLSLVRDVKAAHPKLPILVLSMHDEFLYAERVLRAGAMGFVMKQESADHIVQAIRVVLGGRTYLSEKMTQEMLQRVRVTPQRATSTSELATLSDRELEVFDCIGQGLPTREIAARLFVSVKTVETHIDHIKAKLGIQSGHALIRRAMMWSIDRE